MHFFNEPGFLQTNSCFHVSLLKGYALEGAFIRVNSSHFLQTCLESKALPIVDHVNKYICGPTEDHRFPMGKFSGVLKCLLGDQVITDKQHKELPHLCPALLSAGGTVLAGDIALQRGLACSTAGGTHHAFPGYGSGFCLLNDLAVAAKHMKKESNTRKILIVDMDVHQGDGTALIFKEKPDVFTFSVHCGKNFPFKKQQSDLDINVEDGIEGKKSRVQEHLPWLMDMFHPDLVLYDAGVDPHWEDELGRLRLTDEGLYQRDLYVLQTVIKKGIPVATVIGGGYSRNIDRLARRHSIIHRAAFKVWREDGL
ncbi:uncharacterized protein SYNPCC7002_A1628 [Misgurnus anguillicaudatus]|uniref:uncharacterized protein SYNPCC7002_A1628 n=1 Tax=Misgurnus anguillicaudatus TaxID=75329 RepID=UPI003CCF7839